MADKFKVTPEGYQEAKAWLVEQDLLHLLEKEQSTDGYTLIALANHCYQRTNKSNPK